MVPFLDLKSQYANIKPEIDVAIANVLESTQFTLGNEVAAFEKEFAEYCNVDYGIGVNSGTSALHLALLAAKVGPGDEVITVPFTFVATVAAIYYTGAKPVFVDVDPVSFTIDVSQLERVITNKTKAILPVHLYGQPADMGPIMDIAKQHRLLVIEDACQAHGAEYKGRKVGSIGNMGCFSFYPGKNLGAYGEGGMIVTNNESYVHTLRMLRDWGQERKYHHILKGYNYRMEGIQGAVLRVKLRHLESWNQSRQHHAWQYTRLLANTRVEIPKVMSYGKHVYHVYVIRVGLRDVLQQQLQQRQIHTGIHYPIPVHLMEAYQDLGYHHGDFPHSEKAAQEVLSLPMYPELSEPQLEKVSRAIHEEMNA